MFYLVVVIMITYGIGNPSNMEVKNIPQTTMTGPFSTKKDCINFQEVYLDSFSGVPAFQVTYADCKSKDKILDILHTK